jgi:hypothetical protein
MDVDTLALLAGAILSLAFSYIPGLNARFAGLASEYKRLIMAGLLALVSLAAFGQACAGVQLLPLAATCDQAGAVGLLRVFVLAVVANQGAFALTPQPAAVVAARAR